MVTLKYLEITVTFLKKTLRSKKAGRSRRAVTDEDPRCLDPTCVNSWGKTRGIFYYIISN